MEHTAKAAADRWLAGPAILVLTLMAAACGTNGELPPPDAPGQPEQPREPAPAPGEPSATVSTSTAAPGSPLTVRGGGFAAGSRVEVGLGPLRSEYTVVTEATADDAGRVEATVEVPGWTERGRPYVAVLAASEGRVSATSDPFVVGEAGDAIQVHGELTDEGVECPALRGPFGTLYTLAVSNLEHGAGTQVQVEGTIAGMSICQQGTTIDVESVEPR